MIIPDVTICRVKDVIQLAETERYGIVISIEHPGARSIEEGLAPRLDEVIPDHVWKDRQLILSAWDVEEPTPAMLQGRRQTLNPPGMEFVDSLMKFYMQQTADGHIGFSILLHCHQGKARSGAAALGLYYHAMMHNQAWAESYRETAALLAVRELKRIRPEAAPNLAIVKLFDFKFKAGGALVAAVLADPDIAANRARAAVSRARQAESGQISVPQAG